MGHWIDLVCATVTGALFMYAACWVANGRLRAELARLTIRASQAEAVVTKLQDDADDHAKLLAKEVECWKWKVAHVEDAPRVLREQDERLKARGAHECASCACWTAVGPVCLKCVHDAIEARENESCAKCGDHGCLGIQCLADCASCGSSAALLEDQPPLCSFCKGSAVGSPMMEHPDA